MESNYCFNFKSRRLISTRRVHKIRYKRSKQPLYSSGFFQILTAPCYPRHRKIPQTRTIPKNFPFSKYFCYNGKCQAGRKFPTYPMTSNSTFFRIFSRSFQGLCRAFIGSCRAFPRTPRVYKLLGEVQFVRLVFKFSCWCDVILKVGSDWKKG